MKVRTIRLDSKHQELVNNYESTSISILGIVDHKIVHEDPEIPVKSWNEKILIAHFIGNGFPALTIIVHYSPVEGSDSAEDHYENLLAAIDEIPKHNVLLVVGDFNTHLGEDIAKFTYHKNTNTNGKIVNDLVNEAGLIVTNTQFQKKPAKLWTYISDMSGVKSQVDFIMINKKWRNTVKNCKTYSTFSSIGSDHRVVTAKLKLSLHTTKAPRREVHDWNILHIQDIRDRYNLEVKNRYEMLHVENESAIEAYEHFIQANKEVAKEIIPQRKRAKGKRNSDDARVQNARKDVQHRFNKYQNNQSSTNQESLQKAKTKLQEVHDTVTEKELSEMIRKVEVADENSSQGKS